MKLQIFLLSFTILFSSEIFPQNNSLAPVLRDSTEFTEAEWNKIQKRWDNHQRTVILVSLSGDTASGQLVSINDSVISIYPEKSILLTAEQAQNISHYPVSEIEYFFIKKKRSALPIWAYTTVAGAGVGTVAGLILSQGWSVAIVVAGGVVSTGLGTWIGFKIEKAKKAKKLTLNKGHNDYPKNLKRLKKKMLYNDSIAFPMSFRQALDHSKLMNRTFYSKRLRVSVALSAGPNTIENSVSNAFASAGISKISYNYSPIAFELPDVSWRISKRFIVGGQFYFAGHSDISDFYKPDAFSTTNELEFSYSINTLEARLYLEYAINPIDRFMSKPYEFLIGAGVIMGSQSFDFTSFESLGDNYNSSENSAIQGIQVRSSFHYYFLPSFSLFTGIEANLYTNVNAPKLEFSTLDPAKDYVIPAYDLNFNTLRLKLGTSVHF